MTLALGMRLRLGFECRLCGAYRDSAAAAERAVAVALCGAAATVCPLCNAEPGEQVPGKLTRGLKRLRLEAERQSRAGCVALRRTRGGLLVGLYRSLDAGIETDPEGKWSTVCEEHGGVVSHRTRALAESWLAHPEEWCPDCQEARSGALQGKV